jgi:hypothetical protein
MYIPKNITAECIRIKARGTGMKRSLTVPRSTDQGAGFCAALLVGQDFILLTEECNTMADRKLGQAGRDCPLKNSCKSVVKNCPFNIYKIRNTYLFFRLYITLFFNLLGDPY